jgi:hypothetical protein
MTFSDLLASLGGALGICIGLDVRFIIWIILTPIMAILGFLLNLILKKTGSLFSQARAEKLKKLSANRWVQQISRVCSFGHESDKAVPHDVFQNQAKMTKWLMNVLLWAIYYVISFGLTCKMCTDFYLQYRAGATDFTYKLIQNDSIQLSSSLTICLPLYENFLIDNEMEDYYTEYGDIINILTEDTDQLLNTSTGWSAHFLLTTLSYLALYSNYEQLGNAYYQSSIGILTGNSSVQNIFNLYDEQLAKANITIDELKQKCGQEARKNFTLNIQQYKYSSNEAFGMFEKLEINRTTFISESRLCFNLPIREFFSTSDFIEITVETSFTDTFQQTLLNIDGTISIDILGRDSTNFDNGTTSLMFDSTILINFGDNFTSRISIDDYYQSLPFNNGKQKCSDRRTLEDCQNNCSVTAIRTACNCTPVSWPELTSQLDGKDCTLEQYKNCSPNADNDTACMGKCFRFCTHIRYSELRSYDGGMNYTAHLLIFMKSFSFRQEQEFVVMEFSDFVGAFGGALGFWIGLDVLMIVHFIYLLGATVIRTKYLGARKRVAVVQQQRQEDDIELKSL